MFVRYNLLIYIETPLGEAKEMVLEKNLTKRAARKLMVLYRDSMRLEKLKHNEKPIYISIQDRHIEERYANKNTRKETVRMVHYIKKVPFFGK
ncbi:hypothetical protein HCA55_17360 [Listeria booriae]|uniref:Uncharacterized protein n=1 Tax=Listeria booriae TaxID=1552123 RepID=A0A842B2Z9_9LIST|nr:hypothetical protein [Listeria booriae]MBC1798510.1 hypothetical protein [Listeria booriae]